MTSARQASADVRPGSVPVIQLGAARLALSEDVGASDYRLLYLGRAAMRMRGYEFYRIAVARVPDPPLTPSAAPPQGAAPDASHRR
jgi:hypothetical protein